MSRLDLDLLVNVLLVEPIWHWRQKQKFTKA